MYVVSLYKSGCSWSQLMHQMKNKDLNKANSRISCSMHIWSHLLFIEVVEIKASPDFEYATARNSTFVFGWIIETFTAWWIPTLIVGVVEVCLNTPSLLQSVGLMTPVPKKSQAHEVRLLAAAWIAGEADGSRKASEYNFGRWSCGQSGSLGAFKCDVCPKTCMNYSLQCTYCETAAWGACKTKFCMI